MKERRKASRTQVQKAARSVTWKKIKGKKRHILVDTQGLFNYAIVHAADIQDRDGGAFVMATMFGLYPFLMKLYADTAAIKARCFACPGENNGAGECGDCQALQSRKRICCLPEAVGC